MLVSVVYQDKWNVGWKLIVRGKNVMWIECFEDLDIVIVIDYLTRPVNKLIVVFGVILKLIRFFRYSFPPSLATNSAPKWLKQQKNRIFDYKEIFGGYLTTRFFYYKKTLRNWY